MENSSNSPKRTNKERNTSSNGYPNLASLPTNILNWVDQNMNNIVVVINDAGELIYVNQSIQKKLGYEPISLLGENWRAFISSRELHNIYKVAKELGDHDESLLVHVPDQNEKEIPFECTFKKHKMDDHTPVYIGILKNITNEKEAEEMMIRSEKMSVAGQIAAGIAHEIRNPLTSLKGFLQLLESGVDQKDVYYKIMIDEINKIETITSELLFISKPLTDHKQNESVNDMIEDVFVLLKPQAKLRNILLDQNNVNDTYVYCDRSQMKQVFINLIKNAIEASDDYSTVQIDVQKTDTHVLIDVIDEGVGIPEDRTHTLDEPFYTTKESGTGLGLMITKNILHQHQSIMEIIHNEKKGSTFRIHIPAKPDE